MGRKKSEHVYSYCYVGFDYKNRKNGYLKIGETVALGRRMAGIRQEDSFQLLAAIKLTDCDTPERRLLESVMRVTMKRVPGMTFTQNDHFLYSIGPDKYGQANALAQVAIESAKQEANRWGIEWEDVDVTKYKRG